MINVVSYVKTLMENDDIAFLQHLQKTIRILKDILKLRKTVKKLFEEMQFEGE
jgi:hypothetical protein